MNKRKLSILHVFNRLNTHSDIPKFKTNKSKTIVIILRSKYSIKKQTLYPRTIHSPIHYTQDNLNWNIRITYEITMNVIGYIGYMLLSDINFPKSGQLTLEFTCNCKVLTPIAIYYRFLLLFAPTFLRMVETCHYLEGNDLPRRAEKVNERPNLYSVLAVPRFSHASRALARRVRCTRCTQVNRRTRIITRNRQIFWPISRMEGVGRDPRERSRCNKWLRVAAATRYLAVKSMLDTFRTEQRLFEIFFTMPHLNATTCVSLPFLDFFVLDCTRVSKE